MHTMLLSIKRRRLEFWVMWYCSRVAIPSRISCPFVKLPCWMLLFLFLHSYAPWTTEESAYLYDHGFEHPCRHICRNLEHQILSVASVVHVDVTYMTMLVDNVVELSGVAIQRVAWEKTDLLKSSRWSHETLVVEVPELGLLRCFVVTLD